MKFIARAIGVLLVCVLVGTGRTPLAQSGIRFHHVHLNSVNPDAAAEYYTKVFTTSVRTTFNGEVAIKTVNGPYLLFTKVNAPPRPSRRALSGTSAGILLIPGRTSSGSTR